MGKLGEFARQSRPGTQCPRWASLHSHICRVHKDTVRECSLLKMCGFRPRAMMTRMEVQQPHERATFPEAGTSKLTSRAGGEARWLRQWLQVPTTHRLSENRACGIEPDGISHRRRKLKCPLDNLMEAARFLSWASIRPQMVAKSQMVSDHSSICSELLVDIVVFSYGLDALSSGSLSNSVGLRDLPLVIEMTTWTW